MLSFSISRNLLCSHLNSPSARWLLSFLTLLNQSFSKDCYRFNWWSKNLSLQGHFRFMALQLCSGMLPRSSYFEDNLFSLGLHYFCTHCAGKFLLNQSQNVIYMLNLQLTRSMLWEKISYVLNIPPAKLFNLLY